MAKKNNRAPGMDGVTFRSHRRKRSRKCFCSRCRTNLSPTRIRPTPVRKKEIPKDGGNKVRVLSIPSIRDRVVQGVRLSSSWSRSSKLIFNRGPMATGQSGQPIKRSTGWLKRL